MTSRERYLIFEARKQKQAGGKRAPRPQEPRAEQPRPEVQLLAAEALPEVLAALTEQYEKASTVKITVIDRPA